MSAETNQLTCIVYIGDMRWAHIMDLEERAGSIKVNARGVGEVREQQSAKLHIIRVHQAKAIQETAVKGEARHLPLADVEIRAFV